MTVDSSVLRDALLEFRDAVGESAADILLTNTVGPLVPQGAEDAMGRGRSGPALRDTAKGPIRTGDGTWEIGYEAEHASYTDEGTPPHEIHGNPWLVFFSESAGRVIFLDDRKGQFVNHPGTARQGWWTDTVTDLAWEAECQRQVDTATLNIY